MGHPHGHNRVYDQRGRLVYEGPFTDGHPQPDDNEDNDQGQPMPHNMDNILGAFSFSRPGNKRAKLKDKL